MLRNRSIRAKLFALIGVPLSLLVVAVVLLNLSQLQTYRAAQTLVKYTDMQPKYIAFFQSISQERGLSIQQLITPEPTEQQTAALTASRAATDKAVAALQTAIVASGVDTSESTAAGRLYETALDSSGADLATLRTAVDSDQTTPVAAMTSYNTITDNWAETPLAFAADVADPALREQQLAYASVIKLIDATSIEQIAGMLQLTTGDSTAALTRAGAIAQEDYWADAARARLTGKAYTVLDGALNAAATQQILAAVNEDRAAFLAGSGLSPQKWMEDSTALIVTLGQSSSATARAILDDAHDASHEALVRLLTYSGASLLALVIAVLLAQALARGVVGSVRQLAVAAAQVRDELPRMVERMQTVGEGPSVEYEPLEVRSRDEIGALTEIFNDLNATTVRVAGEQAALRASIADMFVNVARRDQALLARQLAFLDQLERTEENPDTLEDLFTLDHLATRMRRNAESLLVLAGINTGRRLRRPLPLSDVVRTAAGEIEHYDRVDLALQVDPPVVGHLALSASHMIAELLENATNFSEPGSRVVVSTTQTDLGVVVTIRDSGIGMSPEEVQTADERLHGGRASEFVGAQRLGFFVVGRLAGRLDVDVRFESVEGEGTTVTLLLPVALFTPGSVKSAQHELPPAGSGRGEDGFGGPDVPAFQPRPTGSAADLPARPHNGGLPTRKPQTPAEAPAVVTGPLAAEGLSDALAGALSAAANGSTADTGANAATAKSQGRQLPTRRPAPQGGVGATGQPMPQRPAPQALAAAQDILPRSRKERAPRDSATPPRTAAEAFWTSRKRVQGEANAVGEVNEAPQSAPAGPKSKAKAPAPSAAPQPASAPDEASVEETVTSTVADEPQTVLAPAVPGRTVGEALRQRSALAAEALSALTEGQSFTPARGSGSQPLVRRQAGATPAAAKPAPVRTAANRQRRAPADVRSMLSGFQAGVSRGRAEGDAPGTSKGGADGDA